ncbi:MAG: molybdopterin-guanine dinucleotide biosynthesis protein B [Lachnospiraceae bacterium]|nr:molybdopterin-guanine dinucleotide biosynthesis protein B [Lachnospiraceae bacterium]
MNKMKTGTAVLCGGTSRRMGVDKAVLKIGERTFLEEILSRFNDRTEVYLSVRKGQRYGQELSGVTIRYAEDIYEDCGPLGGLHALLSSCEEEALFVTTADLPLADLQLKRELQEYLLPSVDAVIPIDPDGRLHPLCAIYTKRFLPMIEEALCSCRYRVRDVLKAGVVSYVPVTKLTSGTEKLANINTPEDYEQFLLMRKNHPITKNRYGIPVFSLAAYSGSGKTTFLTELIRELCAKEIHTAVIKHDGHDFEIDREGKDSWKLARAGAKEVILNSASKTARMQYYERDIRSVVDDITDADVILIEGSKHGPYQKILFFREAAGKPAAMDLQQEQPVLIISDRRDWPQARCPVFGLQDTFKTACWMQDRLAGE